MRDHHHKPDTTRCGCGVFYGFGRHHSDGFRRLNTLMLHQGLRQHSPTPQGAAVVARWLVVLHGDDGGSGVVMVVGVWCHGGDDGVATTEESGGW
nr:hypothetical protein [Tanacetum cinerariifolium]